MSNYNKGMVEDHFEFTPVVVNGKCTSHNIAVDIIGSRLRISAKQLNLSVSSLEVIDSLTLENPGMDRYELFVPIICYVATVLTTSFDNLIFGIKDDGGNFYMRGEDGKSFNIGVAASDYYLQADYCPNTFMIYREAVSELDLE